MNKKLIGLSVLAATLVGSVAFAMDPILTIASTTPTDLLAYVGQLFTDTTLIWIMAAGVPFGFYVLRRIIAVIPKGK